MWPAKSQPKQKTTQSEVCVKSLELKKSTLQDCQHSSVLTLKDIKMHPVLAMGGPR